NDDPLWLIAATYAYISETQDFSILDIVIPYNNSETEKGTLLEHLDKAIHYTVNHLGPHGLPLIGHADWNDCLNLNCFSANPGESFQCLSGKDGGVAESVFIGAMFVKYGKEYLEILEKIKKSDDLLAKSVEKMKDAMYKYGFEEDHFLRAYDAFGNKVGSNHNEEGQIYIEPQGFTVLSGLGLENGMADKALEATYKRLNTKYGICILSPAYTKYHIELGEISSYPMGYKENGGIFTHNNPWVIIAECVNNNPERAFEYYKQITPVYVQDNAETRRVEPYVYCQMLGGKEAPNFGQGKNSWLTGTASWAFVAVSQYILGIKPTLDGLLINPKMPKEINGFQVKRKYRGHMITINGRRGEKEGVFVGENEISDRLLRNVNGDLEVSVTYR
nr:glycosyl transferase [Bacilli bacterium]